MPSSSADARFASWTNLSTGYQEFLSDAAANPRFDLVTCDLVSDEARLRHSFTGADAVVHLAANADVRFGWSDPRRDMIQNAIATQNVLEAIRITSVPQILFASTGSVYGEAPIIPTPETCPFPLQTSLYGGSKVAAEGLIAA